VATWSNKLETPAQIPDRFYSDMLRELGAPDCDACRNAITPLFCNGFATASIMSAVLLGHESISTRRRFQAEIAHAAQKGLIDTWAVRAGVECLKGEVHMPAEHLLNGNVCIFPQQDRLENEMKIENAAEVIFDTGTVRASVQTKKINFIALFDLGECKSLLGQCSLSADASITLTSAKASDAKVAKWLEEQLRNNVASPKYCKDQIFVAAKGQFSGISRRRFDQLWGSITNRSEYSGWAKPGRRPKRCA